MSPAFRFWLLATLFTILAASPCVPRRCGADQPGETAGPLDGMPAGYNLQSCDDCGVIGRQPHIPANTCCLFSDQAVKADVKARTVAYGNPHFDAVYDGLDANAPYLVAVTYASERGNKRTQSLTAGTVPLHGPRALPDGATERLVFKVPPAAIQNGKLTLHFTLDGGPNAVVSIIELWAPLPSPRITHLVATPLVSGTLLGSVSDLAYQGIAGVQVTARDAAKNIVLAEASTDNDGSFRIDLSGRNLPDHILVSVKTDDGEEKCTVAKSDLSFAPPTFTPMADSTAGLESSVVLLDGAWRINASPSSDFSTEATNGSAWSNFTVPGQWLQQGIDVPRDKGLAVAADFDVPAAWAGRRVFLRFDAVHGGADYWLNGTHLGRSENLFTPVEFDVTDAVTVGKTNHLALGIKVQTPSETASYSSDYAFHNLGGIDRSVRVFSLPATHLSSLHHETLLDGDYRDAVLSIDAKVTNATASAISDVSMQFSLEDPNGKRVPLAQDRFDLSSVKPGQNAFSQRLAVANPLKWSAEKPHLYKLVVELVHSGAVLERLVRSIGFRNVEVHGCELWVNGTPVKLAGMCRHEIDPLTGRAATVKHAEADARWFKDANINFVRTSHYPPTREFLDACDRIGLYVECEAPFCWTRSGRGEDDPAATKHFLTPTAAMIDYHRDHPSVILWSLGNESGCGPDGENRLRLNFAEILGMTRRMDASRPTIFNNEWCKDGGACDLACLHYPPFPAEQYETVKNDPRPLLIDEYFPFQTFTFVDELKLNPGLDIVFWSTGQNSPSSNWNQIYATKRLCGGTIWAGIDEEFFFPDGSVKGYGPWGFVDVWRRPKSLFWDTKRVHAPVWIPVRRIDYQPGQQNVGIPIENRYSFTDLSELRATWEVAGAKGELPLILAPRSSGQVTVPIPANTPAGSLLVLRFFDLTSKLITASGVTLGDAPPHALPEPGSGCPKWHDDGCTITITGEKFHLAMDRTTGELVRQEDATAANLIRFPKLFVSRQETKNVFNPGGAPYAQYPDESTRAIDSLAVEPQEKSLAIRVKDHYANYSGAVELIVDDGGVCTASFDYTYSGEAFTASELGLRFLMDKSCQEIRWRRQTEWDVYPEDHIGRPEGCATAFRDAKWGNTPSPAGVQPPWPWHLDSNEFGTRDFRATKYNIFDATLLATDGSGIHVDADGSVNVRSCLVDDAVQFHVLASKPNPKLSPGDRLSGTFHFQVLPRK